MTKPFQPANGDRARWRYAYDLVVERNPGDDITVDELKELLDIDTDTAWAVMREAKKHLEEDRQQTVRTVSRFGWIVIDARGNLDEIERRRRKAYRATDRAARLIVATPRDQLSQIERSRLDFETKNILAARGLYSRKTRSLSELEKESKRQQNPQLPFKKSS
ncbi:hypothetical protein [Amycolatopsis thermoflava]|uniref:hypothetical protein n=1 Tax=Amycolatopsis thermoflava TaxID=84480 RepID=UPI000411E137|nr:hypothetical protein [Amycolatopsis thermoflava]